MLTDECISLPQTEEGLATFQIVRCETPSLALHEMPDLIAQEVPIALQFNGISHAVLLGTPLDLEDLAVGFSYTEGIVRSHNDIYDVQVQHSPDGIVIDLDIASACLQQLKLRRRQLAGRTGCGLCGLESLQDVKRALPALPEPFYNVAPAAVAKALHQLRQQQVLHQKTGATHAAALANQAGEIQVIREDVGRHNALDKLIGHLLRQDALAMAAQSLALVSSRASFEMVQKTAAAGIPTLVAVSAPTTLATQLAEELNLLLIGFGREQHFNVYSHPQRLTSF